MTVSLNEILAPQTVINVISRIREGQGRLQRLLGMQVAGKNVKQIPGRNAQFRIYDHTRQPAMGRHPGTGPATISANPIGVVNVSMARFHEKVILDYESLGNLSALPGPNSMIDKAGQDYVTRQETTLAERMNVVMELLVAGMLRGQFYLKHTGENLIPVLTQPGSGTYDTINYQIPAGNKSQLNMLGAGSIIDASWATASTTIIKHLMNIKSAFVQLTGRRLAHVIVSSSVWYNIITNTEVRNTAGSSMTPFAEYTQIPEKDSDGEETTEYVAVLRADPTIKWHIIDDVIMEGGGGDPSYAAGTATAVRVVPTTAAIFLPEFSSARMWAQMCHGSEVVVEYPNLQAPQVRQGLYTWTRFTDQPSAIELISLLNCLPVLEAPNNIAFATVVY